MTYNHCADSSVCNGRYQYVRRSITKYPLKRINFWRYFDNFFIYPNASDICFSRSFFIIWLLCQCTCNDNDAHERYGIQKVLKK